MHTDSKDWTDMAHNEDIVKEQSVIEWTSMTAWFYNGSIKSFNLNVICLLLLALSDRVLRSSLQWHIYQPAPAVLCCSPR